MMDYLSDNTRKFVESALDNERIEITKNFKWLGYPVAQGILKKMNNCYHYPTCSRMPNLLIVGDSNNGKTAILNKFDASNLPFIDQTNQKVINPVLLIQAPPEPDEVRFFNAIMEKLYAPIKTTEHKENKQLRVKNLLRDLNVKVLMVDEIHNILAGSPAKQRLFLNVLKYLSNELRIPLICAGTKLAFNTIQTDSQLANRFEPCVLPRWQNDLDYKRLLLSFTKILPLKKESNLIEGSIATKILAKSDGLLGEISKIMELSTILAIESKTEKITGDIIDNIDFRSPSDRKKIFSR